MDCICIDITPEQRTRIAQLAEQLGITVAEALVLALETLADVAEGDEKKLH